jgi:hypothetical protein
VSAWRNGGIDVRAFAADDLSVFDPEAWPQTREAALALVALVLAEILGRSPKADNQLLDYFMNTAWPSARASRQ